MASELKKALLICIVAFLFFSLFLGWFGKLGWDYNFHYSMSRGECSETHTLGQCGGYPPLFSIIASPFSGRPEFFKLFTLFLFAFAMPMSLYWLTKKSISCWFYFACSSYFFTIADGLYAQGLAMLLLVLMLSVKKDLLRVVILFISILVHSTGFYLLAMAYFLLLVYENKYFEKAKGKIKKFGALFAGGFCSPFWATKVPDVLKIKVGGPLGAVWNTLTLNHLLAFFSKMCPLPFLLLSIKGLWKKGYVHYIVLMAIYFVGAFFRGNRLLYGISPLMIAGLAWWYSETTTRNKKIVIVLSVLSFAFLLEQWWAISTGVFC